MPFGEPKFEKPPAPKEEIKKEGPEKADVRELNAPLNLSDIVGMIREFQNQKTRQEGKMLFREKHREQIEEKIELRHRIVEYLLDKNEDEAKEMWRKLPPEFEEQNRGGILAETLLTRIFREMMEKEKMRKEKKGVDLEKFFLTAPAFDSEYKIDSLAAGDKYLNVFQVKGVNFGKLNNLIKELRYRKPRCEDLIIPLDKLSKYGDEIKLIESLTETKDSFWETRDKMKDGQKKLEKKYDKIGGSSFFVIIPTGRTPEGEKVLKENGEFSSPLTRQKFIEALIAHGAVSLK